MICQCFKRSSYAKIIRKKSLIGQYYYIKSNYLYILYKDDVHNIFIKNNIYNKEKYKIDLILNKQYMLNFKVKEIFLHIDNTKSLKIHKELFIKEYKKKI